VAAALPTLGHGHVLHGPGQAFMRSRGVLNGTTNYILNALASGKSYQCLAEAAIHWRAEANPNLTSKGLTQRLKS
jgi:homoserine dehydrogenase